MFTLKELELIKESLDYTKKSILEYDGYPSYEFKQKRMKEVNELRAKVRGMMKE